MRLSTRARSRTWPATLLTLAGLALLPLLLESGGRYQFAVTLGMIYGISAVGLDLFSGYAGVLCLSNFGFVAIGAYTSTVLAVQYDWNLWATLPATVVMCAVISLIVGAAIVRLEDLGAALGTFFFAFIAVVLIEGPLLAKWTAAADGLRVPPLTLGSWELNDDLGLYLTALVALAAVLAAANRYVHSRAGRSLRLVKRSQVVAGAMGVNSYAARLIAFVFSSTASGIAGFLFAQAVVFLAPESFRGFESIMVLAMAVVGGLGSIAGPVLGAVAFNVLDEIAGFAAAARELLFALMLLSILILMPGGIFGGLETAGHAMKRLLTRLRGDAPEAMPDAGVRVAAVNLEAVDTDVATTAPLRHGAATIRPESTDVILRIDGLSVQFSGIHALENVSLSVPRGCIYGIMGPNGAGKTTLINCVSRIQEYTGRIELDGESLDHLSPRIVRRRGVARTFQHPSLVPDLTVDENVQLGNFGNHPRFPLTDIIPLPATFRRERQDRLAAIEALDLVGLATKRRSVLASELTLAEQKLVDVARAVAGRCPLILMDEPTAGLEEDDVEALAAVVRRVRDEAGVTIVVIAHHVGFLRSIADRAAVLNFGTVLVEGHPNDVVLDERVAKVFLGDSTLAVNRA